MASDKIDNGNPARREN